MSVPLNYAFTIGRMNPPTSGHMDLIRLMMETVLDSLDSPPELRFQNTIFIILSHTVTSRAKPDYKNPLDCLNEKKMILNDFVIPKIKEDLISDITKKNEEGKITQEDAAAKIAAVSSLEVILICMDEYEGKHPIIRSILRGILHVTGDNTKLTLFIGQDRAGSYGFIKPILLGLEHPIEMVEYFMPRTKDSMSATKKRAMVVSQDRDEFNADMDIMGVPEELSGHIYGEIDDRLEAEKIRELGILCPIPFTETDPNCKKFLSLIKKVGIDIGDISEIHEKIKQSNPAFASAEEGSVSVDEVTQAFKGAPIDIARKGSPGGGGKRKTRRLKRLRKTRRSKKPKYSRKSRTRLS